MERLWSLAIVLSQGMQAGLAERGLSLARAHVIWQLQREGPVTQRRLSQALGVTPRNVTGLVDALEADGIVARAPHPSDRRATLVSLTDRGAATAQAMAGDQGGFADLLFSDVPEAELETLIRILDQVVRRVEQVMPAG